MSVKRFPYGDRDRIQLCAFNVRFERYQRKLPAYAAMALAIIDTSDDRYARLSADQIEAALGAVHYFRFSHKKPKIQKSFSSPSSVGRRDTYRACRPEFGGGCVNE